MKLVNEINLFYDARSIKPQIKYYMFDLVWVLEVKWDKGGAEMANDYVLFYTKWNENGQLDLEYIIYERELHRNSIGD